MKQKFFRCKTCGNIAVLVVNKGAPLVCCGAVMEEMSVNTVDASMEKHIPTITVNDCTLEVNVGSIDHPMEEGHFIDFVYVETENGGQRKKLQIGAAPHVSFCLKDDKAVAVYAYCNLHGLWACEL